MIRFESYYLFKKKITLKISGVFDKRTVDKGQVRFFYVAYLKTKEKIKGNTIQIKLTDFVKWLK